MRLHKKYQIFKEVVIGFVCVWGGGGEGLYSEMHPSEDGPE